MVKELSANALLEMAASGTPMMHWPRAMRDGMVAAMLPYPVSSGDGGWEKTERMSLDILRFLMPSARTFAGAPQWMKEYRTALAQSGYAICPGLVDDLHYLISSGLCKRGALDIKENY